MNEYFGILSLPLSVNRPKMGGAMRNLVYYEFGINNGVALYILGPLEAQR